MPTKSSMAVEEVGPLHAMRDGGKRGEIRGGEG